MLSIWISHLERNKSRFISRNGLYNGEMNPASSRFRLSLKIREMLLFIFSWAGKFTTSSVFASKLLAKHSKYIPRCIKWNHTSNNKIKTPYIASARHFLKRFRCYTRLRLLQNYHWLITLKLLTIYTKTSIDNKSIEKVHPHW